VKQHGVLLFTHGSVNGGLTVHRRMPMRPHTCLGVAIQPRHTPNTTLTKLYKLPAGDRPRVFDRAIAHELLHAIGVDHHGAGDGVAPFRFVFGDDPLDGPTDRLEFSGAPARLLHEANGADLFARLAEERRRARDALWGVVGASLTADATRRSSETAGMVGGDARLRALPPEQQARHELNREAGRLTFWLGGKQGECSGHDQCVMRYYFAELFERDGSATDFYFIATDPEPAGLSLCDSAAGTGINGPRTPEPRFGNADTGRGDCARRFCVNDAIP
jgi:hypothetical protein